MQTILRKLSSRKLWLAIAGVAAGIAMSLGVDASDITTVAGAITAIVSVATYIVTEGKIDAAAVKRAIEGTQEAMEAVGEQDDG